jgi:hypothetical protein
MIHPGPVMTSRRARNTQAPGRFPAPGLPGPGDRALVLAGHRLRRAPAGAGTPRRARRAPAQQAAPGDRGRQ